jgi:hypothetical protein
MKLLEQRLWRAGPRFVEGGWTELSGKLVEPCLHLIFDSARHQRVGVVVTESQVRLISSASLW